MTIEAETGGMQSPVKECQGLPTAAQVRETWNVAFRVSREPTLLTLWFYICVCVCVYIYIYIYFFFKINLFIFDWSGSSLLPGLFSGCRKQVLVCSCGVWASYGSGLSCCERGLQGTCISGIALSGLISCGSQALEPRLNSCGPWVQWLRVWNLGSSQTRD